jgi:hypothetical protein
MRRRIATAATALLLLTGAAVAAAPSASASVGTCDPATRSDTYNQITIQEPLPDGSGSVLVDVHFGWDGTSVRPNCDGPVSYLRTRNTGTSAAWAWLPGKKKGATWVQIDPGTDVTVTAKGTLNNLGLTNFSDVQEVGFAFTQPA